MKVYVGLSGGVDSGVSAALLKERGFDVVGCFIKIWQPEFIECTWREDRLDAMRVCAALGIPFEEIDLSEEYKREVVEPMIAAYARGITPNPDVLCNRSIKFGHFARWAFSQGAEVVATGHYARVAVGARGHQLLRGKDATKDQSYFLYRIEPDVLARTLFPIGDFEKTRVRSLAARFELAVAKKPDSQGLCFVGDVSMKEFLARYMSLAPGSVLDVSGAVIGTHDGAALYTRGQRHGFRAQGGVQYVTSVDVVRNTITVSPNRSDASSKTVILEDVHWIQSVSFPLRAYAQARYREKSVAVEIIEQHGRVQVSFDEPRLIAPGQSLVVYDGEVCLGGGVIAAVS